MRPDARSDLRITADRLAITDHTTHPATTAHQIIGGQIWRAVRALGYRQGRVLTVGDGAGPLLGVPGPEHTPGGSLVADFDAGHRPSRAVRPLTTQDGAAGFDVVITALPAYDVRLTYRPTVLARRAVQLTCALAALRLTTPGGLTALLATHDLMDHPAPDGRRRIAELADLIGALRLPAGTYRRTPGTDEVTDVLLLRRRPTREPRRGPDFEDAPMVCLDGAIVTINTYFDTNIDQVLGTLQHDPTGASPTNVTVTVTGPADRLAAALAARMNHVIATGHRYALTMATRAAPAVAPLSIYDLHAYRPTARRRRLRTAGTYVPDPARPHRDLAGPGLEQR